MFVFDELALNLIENETRQSLRLRRDETREIMIDGLAYGIRYATFRISSENGYDTTNKALIILTTQRPD